MVSLPSGFRAFLRRLGMVTLARDERRLRFWSSRPIVVMWWCGSGGVGGWSWWAIWRSAGCSLVGGTLNWLRDCESLKFPQR